MERVRHIASGPGCACSSSSTVAGKQPAHGQSLRPRNRRGFSSRKRENLGEMHRSLHEQKRGLLTKKTSCHPRITCQPNPDIASIPAKPATHDRHRHDNVMFSPHTEDISWYLPPRLAAGLAIRRSDQPHGFSPLVSQFKACCRSYCGVRGGLGVGGWRSERPAFVDAGSGQVARTETFFSLEVPGCWMQLRCYSGAGPAISFSSRKSAPRLWMLLGRPHCDNERIWYPTDFRNAP